MEFTREKSPWKKPPTNYFQTTVILATPSILIFFKQKNKYIKSYLIFLGLAWEDCNVSGWETWLWVLCRGGRIVLALLLGQQQCTAGFRDTPPTRRPNAIHTVHPNSCPWLELQHQSNFSLSQPCHPSHCPTQCQMPAPMRPNINTTLQLLGGEGVLRCRLIGNRIDLF